jgi:NAD(P)-dependent dehydrogenase (short-subunit alcohol dehydrogenase family)
LARAKIRVNAVRPGLTQSGGGAQLILSDDKLRERTLAMIPFNRAGTPDEVAAAVRYLAGPESGYTTGQSFGVDGGLELGATNAGHG